MSIANIENNELGSSVRSKLNASIGGVNSLNSVTGSFATTGSNNFVGDQTITGSVNITGSSSITGLLDLTNGKKSVYIGTNVGAITGSKSSEYNVGIGYDILPKLIPQGFNSGTSNVAIGSFSMYESVFSRFSIAIGEGGLYSKTNSNFNIAIGYYPMSNADGLSYGNIAIGESPLDENTTGDENIAIGNQSQRLNTTGAENISIGSGTNYSNEVGDSNIAIGHYSLYSNVEDANVAVGYSALDNLGISGSNNTAVGHNAGSSLTSGRNNIIIGNGANASGTGVSNEITLGNSNIKSFRIPGLGYYNVSGSVGIGTTTPTAKLEVSGSTLLDGTLNITGITSGSIFSGSFVGDGSGLTGIGVDTSAFATTGSNNFVGDQVITGSLDLQADNDYKIDGQRVIHKVSGSYILLNDNVDLFEFNTTSLNEGNIIIGGATSGDAESYSRSNVIIGANAHQNLPATEYGTVIGASAGSMPAGYTQCREITLVGNAASKNVGAAYSTFIGSFAGWSFSTGFNNTADYSVYVGRSAGSRPQVAGGMHNNVAVGSFAMERAYLSSSVALGYYAGRSSSDGQERRGSLVTLVGPYTNVSQSVNLINATAIGANVEVEQSNTVILGNNADVGIGTTTPTAKLEVSGSVVISDILTLEPTHPAPASAPSGSIISSGSGAELKPYFWNGSTWTSMI